MEGDDTEGGDPSVGVQRERGKISKFKIISLIGMCALYFQTWGTYAPATLEKKKNMANCHHPTWGELQMSSNKKLVGWIQGYFIMQTT